MTKIIIKHWWNATKYVPGKKIQKNVAENATKNAHEKKYEKVNKNVAENATKKFPWKKYEKYPQHIEKKHNYKKCPFKSPNYKTPKKGLITKRCKKSAISECPQNIF